MTCKKCSLRENCDICKSAELDTLDVSIKFSCYKFKPIITDSEVIKDFEEALRVAEETINRQKAEIEGWRESNREYLVFL